MVPTGQSLHCRLKHCEQVVCQSCPPAVLQRRSNSPRGRPDVPRRQTPPGCHTWSSSLEQPMIHCTTMYQVSPTAVHTSVAFRTPPLCDLCVSVVKLSVLISRCAPVSPPSRRNPQGESRPLPALPRFTDDTLYCNVSSPPRNVRREGAVYPAERARVRGWCICGLVLERYIAKIIPFTVRFGTVAVVLRLPTIHHGEP
jgi:hypothetical protein